MKREREDGRGWGVWVMPGVTENMAVKMWWGKETFLEAETQS